MSNNIIVRVQSAEHGTKRIQTKATEKIQEFLKKVKQEFDLSGGGWMVYTKRDKTGELKSSKAKSLSSHKIKHGDMVYLSCGPLSASTDADMPDSASPAPSYTLAGGSIQGQAAEGGRTGTPSGPSKPKAPLAAVVEDEVDQFLDKLDGRIPRPKNEQLCHHGDQGKCLHCVPFEPYDEEYLQSTDPPIKFLAFHSHIRKLCGGVDKGKFAMLENHSCKIKSGCKEHPPWPGGICTKCQPSAITLNRQKYRHVDYIQFENPFLMERFLNYWRSTGNQRIGFMYGRYEHHKDAPLAIKAVVAAIYEPPQISTKNTIELLDDDREHTLTDITKQLGLVKVGWIFTDLVAEDLKKGTVKHVRGHMDSIFLSAEECIMAAHFQNQHPSPCKLSPDGHFGSKFSTVVVTGDMHNQIHFDGYQVSNQCMALVNDDCLVPTIDASELGYVKESTNEQYVPDVFYKHIDSYGNEVTQLARPLPVEYLIIDLPAAFPLEPMFTFPAGDSGKPFSIENRSEMGEVQDFHTFSQYIQQYMPDRLLQGVSDLHVLLYLATCDMLPLKDHIGSLLEAVKNKDDGLSHHWFKSEEWGTVEQLISANAPSPTTLREPSFVGPNASPLPPIGGAAASQSMWTCAHCTFLNPGERTVCDMCSLPK